MKTIADYWLNFSERVLPEGTTDGQRETGRRIFYAGAQAMFNLVLNADTDADEVHKELSDYVKAVLVETQKIQ